MTDQQTNEAVDNPETCPEPFLLQSKSKTSIVRLLESYSPPDTIAYPLTSANLTLTIAEWRARALKDPDFLLGSWLTTTSRVLMTAATGIGKTNFGLALAQRISAGAGFLHWQGRRPAMVLYIDGEMSGRRIWKREEER